MKGVSNSLVANLYRIKGQEVNPKIDQVIQWVIAVCALINVALLRPAHIGIRTIYSSALLPFSSDDPIAEPCWQSKVSPLKLKVKIEPGKGIQFGSSMSRP